MAKNAAKRSAESSRVVLDDLERLQGKHFERVRFCAEKGLRSLIHKEFQRRLGLKMSSLKGKTFPNPAARMREARRRIGIQHDECFGGELSLGAIFAITTSEDAAGYLHAADHDAVGTIFGGLYHLQIGASAIARVIVEAHASVKKSVRLLRAEEAAEHECATAANDPAGRQANDALKTMLAKSSRRRTFGGL